MPTETSDYNRGARASLAPATNATARRNRKRRIYSRPQLEAINSQLPMELKAVMDKTGWNAFGLYEACREVLKRVP